MSASTTGTTIAAAIAGRRSSAAAVIDDCLARIERLNPVLNAFTNVTADRARAQGRGAGRRGRGGHERRGRWPACRSR